MAFTRTWNAAYMQLPADTDAASEGANRIRDFKTDIKERVAIDHSMAGDADDGKHLQVTFKDPLGAKPTASASEGYIYTKDVAAKAELFWEDEDGNEIQLTSGGALTTLLLATYDPATIAGQLVGLVAAQTLTNKTLTSPVLNTGVSGTAVKDEDNMSSDSATHLATQQSIKKYVDDSIVETFREGTGTSFGNGTLETYAHGLSGVPDIAQVKIVCTDAGGDVGFAQNDVVILEASNVGASSKAGFSLYVDATNVYVRLVGDSDPITIAHKSTGAAVNIDETKWEMYVNAIYFGA